MEIGVFGVIILPAIANLKMKLEKKVKQDFATAHPLRMEALFVHHYPTTLSAIQLASKMKLRLQAVHVQSVSVVKIA
jgi:hypothetical protein